MEDLSHDSVKRFLLRERYEPKDLFDEVRLHINLVGGTKSYDETVLAEFKELHSIRWGIECYHRAIKQVCGIERFMVSQCVGRLCRLEATGEPVRVRTFEAIKTHFFSAIRAFTQLELMRSEELIENWYELQINLCLVFRWLVTSFWNILNKRWA